MWIELIGYLGMGLILISFMMKDIKLVRTINVMGAILSATYGILTNTWATAILNFSLIIINVIYLSIIIYHERRKNK